MNCSSGQRTGRAATRISKLAKQDRAKFIVVRLGLFGLYNLFILFYKLIYYNYCINLLFIKYQNILSCDRTKKDKNKLFNKIILNTRNYKYWISLKSKKI